MHDEDLSLKEPFLLIDDESDFLETMVLILATIGYEVLTSTGGADALQKIRDRKPFLVLADFRMPEVDGLEICKTARKNGFDRHFVLFTGFADKTLAVRSLEAGVDEILEKPVASDALRELVRKYASLRIETLRKQQRELEREVRAFAAEARDVMQDIDHLFLRMEQDSLDSVVADLLISKVHAVANAARRASLAHGLLVLLEPFEAALNKVRRDSVQPDEATLDLFLESTDLVRSFLDSFSDGGLPDEETLERTRSAVAKYAAAHESAAGVSVTNSTLTQSKSAMSAEIESVGVLVSNDKLDAFMKLSGEMVVLKNNIAMAIRDAEVRANPERLDKKLNDFLQAFSKVSDALQDQIMSVRKVNLAQALVRVPRLVRQLERDVGRKVTYEAHGLELGVDKSIAKALSVSLIHMMRNSVDHGIEEPTARIEAGKPAAGRLSVHASHSQGIIQVIVADDGRGLDRSRIAAKAIEKGLLLAEQNETLSDQEIFEFMFVPGFSTAERVSAVSGRGVGMDVVRSEVLALNGRIAIETEKGKGTRFVISIPVPRTVMVEQTVIARSAGSLIAVPLESISRIVPGDEIETIKMGANLAFQHENRTVRLIDHRSFSSQGHVVARQAEPKGSVIVLRNKDRFIGLLVDAIYDQLEAVVRPFDSIVQSLPGFRGTTLLGDDRIAYVVSPADAVGIVLGSEGAA